MLTAKKFLSFLREKTRLFFRLSFSPFFTDSGSETTGNFLSEKNIFFNQKEPRGARKNGVIFSPTACDSGVRKFVMPRRKQFLPLINGTWVFDSQNLPLNLELQ